MRMWGVNPKKLCDKHLLGEHVEMHMFVGAIKKNKSLKGYIEKGLVELHNIRKRHDELARELIRRKFKHSSPMSFSFKEKIGRINIEINKKELAFRCKKCKFK